MGHCLKVARAFQECVWGQLSGLLDLLGLICCSNRCLLDIPSLTSADSLSGEAK